MSAPQIWELLANIVTALGFPFGIFVFWAQQRKARENEAQHTWALLTDNYIRFMELVLEHPDLGMNADEPVPNLSEEQRERTTALFSILLALFERSYLNLYRSNMRGRELRRWRAWEDYMRAWCRRSDFRAVLPDLATGGDPEFVAFFAAIARREAQAARAPSEY